MNVEIFGNDSEIWRSIDGYLNYQVSTHGRIRNSKTGRLLKPGINIHGYYYVNLCKKNNKKVYYIHYLVAREFIDNHRNKKCVDHIDHNKLNNCIDNLRWSTYSENSMNRVKSKNRTSIYKGVSFHKPSKKWLCHIALNNKIIHVGLFDTEIEGAQAYNEKAKELFGEYALLNKLSNSEYEDIDSGNEPETAPE